MAIVRRSKDDRWVLPRGKLKRDEDPLAGAKREVLEETGHRVTVHEFLGAITYSARGRPKLVQFWRMQAAERQSHELSEDITEVRWLSLSAAIRRLSFPLEKIFLRSVGRRALKRRHRKTARRKPARRTVRSRKARRSPARKKKTVARRPRKKRHARPVLRLVAPPAPRPVPAPVVIRALPPPVRPTASGPSIFRRILGRVGSA